MNLKHSLVAVSAALTLMGTSHAAFYVNDDSPVVAAQAEVARKDKRLYLSFTGTRLLASSRAELENAADAQLSADSVTVVTYATSKARLVAANRRVALVRSVLVRRGISPDRISASAELDKNGDAADTDVLVTFRSVVQSRAADAMRTARFMPQPIAPVVQPAPLPVAAQPPAPQPGQNAATLSFVKKIMAMASSKLISQESAVRLVNEYLSNLPAPGPADQGPGTVATGAPAGTSVAQAPQIVPFGEVPRVWTLAANKSLRDNMRDWALAAGYAEPAWRASNVFQITYTSTYTGTYLEVLNQVANAVPAVDFRVSRSTRSMEVVDAAR